ncbi:hypothetical protein X727_18675 [Mesorhizobium sp. L103C119B0]|nr:hypothetical protein X745_21570 [Mesorhizobium sp. LNJC374B00]ESY61250.1 hypothetical protein X744_04090 [Mesorhizobium sp. LNJC372A00]ESZ63735.1 hypothetical protein X728_08735 [Mesorhizobium sp. L103C120A0]ESZ69153.1 hypothetical protein X727_18675 [Mesorhizobium sp. L103C119B0]
MWWRNRIPTITVRAGLVGDVLPATVVNELMKPSVDAFIAKLPPAIPLQPPARSKKAQKARDRSQRWCR